MVLDLGQEKNYRSDWCTRHTGDEDIRKRDVPRECRKKKSPQRGFGGDDSGFHCLCFYFVVSGQSLWKRGGGLRGRRQRKFIYNIKMIYFWFSPLRGEKRKCPFHFYIINALFFSAAPRCPCPFLFALCIPVHFGDWDTNQRWHNVTSDSFLR